MKNIHLNSPIILFLYNRLRHSQETIEALQKNDLAKESDLYVFCDGPKQDATEEQIARIQEVQSFTQTLLKPVICSAND